jgi:gliding motility-associated protein GldM
MAGGKLTPRQKMINLMYLVFIAMLALNMSKEVLSAFGNMNEKFEASNESANLTNEQMLASLDMKAIEAKGEFAGAAITAHKVEAATKKIFDFVATAKAEVLKGVKPENGKLPYEQMDKSDNLNNSWFASTGLSPRGKAVMSAIEVYKADMKAALGGEIKYSNILNQVNKAFDLSDVSNKDGIPVKYLEYHFQGFPAIASLAKLSAWQSDVKKAESDVISAALGKAAVQAASYNNYQAIVVLEKNAYFQGETVKGKVVLGRYDENTKPTSFQGPGKLENGQAVISLTAGGVGEQKINGQFSFMEDGKSIPLKFEGNYVVVPRPNSATIAADKMNVVYRGVVNPMTISFAGIADSDVSASGAGLSKATGSGKYNMSPGQGVEVLINVTGKLPDGTSVTDKKAYRIKNIPAPQGAIGGTVGETSGAKGRLAVSEITAQLVDFDFDVKLKVTQFTFRVSGQPSVVVNGDRVNKQCEAAMARAGRGDIVTISEIKTKIEGSPILLRQTAPAFYEIK